MDDTTANPTEASPPAASLCILASGSAGNCTVLLLPVCGQQRVILIDAGISPRRTRRLLAEAGLSLDMLDSIVLTHLDHDHWNTGWLAALPEGTPVHLHRRHAAAGRREGILPESARPFDGDFDICPGVSVSAAVASHDALGVATFRFEFATAAAGGASLGFATDLGRVTDGLIDHLRGVDVLAIESNYCPRMQEASPRPAFLKRRIMGGSGHLSNEQSLRAVEEIGPGSDVILLHLSRQCNHPDLVAELHHGAPYRVTIAEQTRATPWVHIRPSLTPRARRSRPAPAFSQLPLFSMAAPAAPKAEAPTH